MMLYSRQEAALTAVLLAAGLLPMNVNAYVSFSKNGEELINTLHTHTYSPTLSLPSSKEIKVAKVCFITDVSDCSGNEFANSEDLDNPNGGGMPDYDLNDAERCKKEGYTLTSCAEGETPEGFCIYDNNFFKKCACPSGYKTCEPPYYGVGQACGNKYASCEKDTERACKELNPDYTNTCESGWQINPNNKCKYDSSFGTCCNQCVGYDYTTIPEGYIQDGDACTDCNGQTKYKVKINPCDGFMDCGSMGPAAGASSCQSGSQIKYDNCKPCPNLGTLTSCPSPYTCTYEECSNRYYKSGCQSGYDWDATNQTCTAQCAKSYKYLCTGTNETGGSGTACNGKYKSCTCETPYSWISGKCACDSSYKYLCTGTNEKVGGTACNGKYQSCACKSGYKWDTVSGSCVCVPDSDCSCQCNSATDCSNCSPSSYYDERCTRTFSNGCGGKCQQWGRWKEYKRHTRNCINAAGEIVLSYDVIEWSGSSYGEKIYCDGVLTKSFGYMPGDVDIVQIAPVTYPAETVTCNKKWDWDHIRDDYTITIDYNTKYCGGTAQSVTVELLGIDEGSCKY